MMASVTAFQQAPLSGSFFLFLFIALARRDGHVRIGFLGREILGFSLTFGRCFSFSCMSLLRFLVLFPLLHDGLFQFDAVYCWYI